MALVAGLPFVALTVALGVLPYGAFATRYAWTDWGPGCCNPVFKGGVLFDGRLDGGDCLDVCQAQCVRFGELCGYVNHGWVENGKPSTWCTVVSAKATVQHWTGHSACGERGGDNGVRCFGYRAAPTENFFASSWTDLGVGCVEPHDSEAKFLFKGQVEDELEACMVKCMSYGLQCGFVNYGRTENSAWCSVVSAKEATVKFTAAPSCGLCKDCGVHSYRYKVPTAVGPWLDAGAGCCVPDEPCDYLLQGAIADSLETCQQQCALYGELCGYVNYGWSGAEVDPTRCSVISVKAAHLTLTSGSTDCGSCGDCGVHCWEIGPAKTPEEPPGPNNTAKPTGPPVVIAPPSV